jgi:hypothetical protein
LTGFMINDSKWIFLSQDLWSMIQYKSSVCIVRHGSNIFGVRICDHNMIWIHGFAKWIHVFTNLLYNSRILNLKICAFYIKLPSLYTFYIHQTHTSIWANLVNICLQMTQKELRSKWNIVLKKHDFENKRGKFMLHEQMVVK